MITTELGKLQKLDADPKVIQQIKFTGNINWAGKTTVFHS